MFLLQAWLDHVSTVLHGRSVDSGSGLFLATLFLGFELSLVYFFANVIYNLYFHPLAHFPGPFLARSTLLWRAWHTMGGKWHFVSRRVHDKYGDIVRVSPNELSCGSLESWKEIYGQPANSPKNMLKADFYDIYGSAYKSRCILSERDPQVHTRMYKSLAPVFSTKALVDQEEIVQSCVAGFLQVLGDDGSQPAGLNMTRWYEMLTFDVLGEMAFGESFESVKKKKQHPWEELFPRYMFWLTVFDNLRRSRILSFIGQKLLPSLTFAVRDQHSQFSRDKIARLCENRRLERKSPRKDFFTSFVEKVESGEVSQEELTAHSSTLVIAGAETTATFLATVTFHLLTNPTVYRNLRTEIRQSFTSASEINATAAQALPYLQAVVSEGLRRYPPAPFGLPRVSPGAMVAGRYVPAGVELYTNPHVTAHDPRYFQDPFEFRPERWLDPNSTDKKDASQPFSTGSRTCMGKNFAYFEIAIVLTRMLYTYDLELLNPSLDWDKQSKSSFLWIKPDLFIRFHRRE
ncbi:hypothetical protein HYFRA_00000794 [Hymenoscyphus fraxineus]|uniref:Cytochrome P450 n=1 Tax=Hymenoscyphus fraxineus TaxID=746836 RepID=A0A9N9PR25_9HELO|nr:hypothetical protein HYFRA_00000794 [Hymenoscyphus fraxineus]